MRFFYWLKYTILVVAFFLPIFLIKQASPVTAQACGVSSGAPTVSSISVGGGAGTALPITTGSDSLPFMAFNTNVFGTGAQSKVLKCGNASCSTGNTLTTLPGGGALNGIAAAVTSDNRPVVSYMWTRTLLLEKCSNAACTSRTEILVDGATPSGNTEDPYTGTEQAMTLDTAGIPALVYSKQTSWSSSTGGYFTQSLYFTKCTNINCSAITAPIAISSSPSHAPSGGASGFAGVSMFIPPDNNPIIAYYIYDLNDSTVTLYFRKCTNSTCTTGTTRNFGVVTSGVTAMTGPPYVWNFPTTAVGQTAGGFPFIAYYNGGPKLIACTNTSCSTSNAAVNISTATQSNKVGLTVPSDGRPLVAYTTSGGLQLSKCANTTCSSFSSTNAIAGTNGAIQEKYIVMGSDGYPYISFRDTTGGACGGSRCPPSGTNGTVKTVKCVDSICSPSVASSCVSSTPNPPSGITVVEGDANGGAVIQTRNIKIDWSFTDNGSGCGTNWGLNCGTQSNQFIIRITGPAGFTPFTSASLGSAVRTYTTGNILTQNGSYTVNVCANNGVLESCGSVVINKVPYATGVLSGSLLERTPNSSPITCNVNGVRASYVSSISLTGAGAGVTTNCGITPAAGIATSYGCTVTLDNTAADPNPNASYTLQFGAPTVMYGSIACGASCTAAGSCANIFTPDLDANGGTTASISQTAYLNLQNTISGGPSAYYGYYKVKNLSYYDHDTIQSIFPAGYTSYDTDDSPIVEHFSRGDDGANFVGAGVVVSNGTQSAGAYGATNNGMSPRGWTNAGYNHADTSAIATKYTDYVKNRRDFKTITSLTDTNFTANNNAIFLVNGNLTISTAADVTNLSNKNAIIVVTGSLNINTNLTSATSNLAFVATSVYISETVTEVRALIMGNAVSLVSNGFASVGTNPLKIVGTIASGATVDTTRRTRSDSFKPALFIMANPDVYINLLNNLSAVRYDWKQTQ